MDQIFPRILVIALALWTNTAQGGHSTVWCMYHDENACGDCARDFNMSLLSDGDFPTVNESNVLFMICSHTITLDGVTILFSDSANVTITSATNLSTASVICKQKSGIHLLNLVDVIIESVSLDNCGTAIRSQSFGENVIASMLIENSTNVALDQVSIHNSIGSGLLMLDNKGKISITDSIFRNSSGEKLQPKLFRVGGVHIAYSSCGWKIFNLLDKRNLHCENENRSRAIEDTLLTITGSHFIDNNSDRNKIEKTIVRGGGLSIFLLHNSSRNTIRISNCFFNNNVADYGGGLYIIIEHNPRENLIVVESSLFVSNKCPHIAGGGVTVWFLFDDDIIPRSNRVVITDCDFTRNQARHGGGVFLFSSSSLSNSSNNSIDLNNCRWTGNKASLGAAIEVAPFSGAIRTFTNRAGLVRVKISNSTFSGQEGLLSNRSNGAAFIQEFEVTFSGMTTFTNNTVSSIYLSSSAVTFEPMSDVCFVENYAPAINMIGQSTIKISDNSNFNFRSNKACTGPAIHQVSVNPYDFFYSRSCFITYVGDIKDVSERNIEFQFVNNTADCVQHGNSVHITTLEPCNTTDRFNCTPKFGDVTSGSIFNCIANFTFSEDINKEVSTEVKSLKVTNNATVQIMPGIEANLPVSPIDELNNNITGVYLASLSNINGSIAIDSAYLYIARNSIKLFGNPGATATLSLVIESANTVTMDLQVSLQNCPPGYVIDSSHHANKVCTCSAYSKDVSQRYKCIQSCYDDITSALLDTTYWIGYKDEDTLNRNGELLYAYCPRRYCSNDNTTKSLTNESHLNSQLVCNYNRTGKICSQCTDGYTAHYHSDGYRCDTTKTCPLGWLYYILSELLPVTILFLVIVVFDIKLTSGTVNGFIYFAQTVNVIIMHMRYSKTPKTLNVLLQMHSFIVRIFNLKFFQIDGLSFCLWPNAQTLDMLMFRYVTTIYSLLLLLLIVISAHKCHGGRTRKFLRKFRSSQLTAKSTLIHGIAGFLVLSYSECISTSIKLLIPVYIYSKGHVKNNTAVLYNGELTYFRGKHLIYAIPSVVILATFGLVPPFLLITYPLCYKVLALLKLNESKFSHVLCTYIPLEKMKPLFDSFQSSFKDRYRFFSGLYFIFRLFALAIQGISDNLPVFYTAIQVQTILVFALHVVAQPYKRTWHNIAEGFFLFDLILIAMTFSISEAVSSIGITIVQIGLLYFPLVFMTAYTGRPIWLKAKAAWKQCQRKNKEDFEYHEFTDSSIFQAAETRQ